MDLNRVKSCADRWLTGIMTVCALLMVYMLIVYGLGMDLEKHSFYDSYTLQTMAWRNGETFLADGERYSWLELAIYQGKYYVSFPPFPSVALLPLTWIYGAETPTLTFNLFMLLCTGAFGYGLLLRLGLSPRTAAATDFFYVCGCNFLIIMLRGGVWYTAQGMSMLLTTAFFYGVTTPPEKHNRCAMAGGLICLALSVGCRPFQAVYVPYALYKLWKWQRDENTTTKAAGPSVIIRRMIPYLIVPFLIACAYGWYNTIRFNNPFEFGHNYLPEFTREGNQQFSFSHWFHNLNNIFRMPKLVNGKLTFDMLGPTALPLTMPLFVICLMETTVRFYRQRTDAEDGILVLSLFVHFNLLLLHRTLGGMQFGVRYMIDLMPALLLLTFRKKKCPHVLDILLMLLGIAMNVYGAIVFYIY